MLLGDEECWKGDIVGSYSESSFCCGGNISMVYNMNDMILVPIRSDFVILSLSYSSSLSVSLFLSFSLQSHLPTMSLVWFLDWGINRTKRWATGLNSKERRGRESGWGKWKYDIFGYSVSKLLGWCCVLKRAENTLYHCIRVLCFCFCIFPWDLGKMDLTASSSGKRRVRERRGRDMKTCSFIYFGACLLRLVLKLCVCCFRL